MKDVNIKKMLYFTHFMQKHTNLFICDDSAMCLSKMYFTFVYFLSKLRMTRIQLRDIGFLNTRWWPSVLFFIFPLWSGCCLTLTLFMLWSFIAFSSVGARIHVEGRTHLSLIPHLFIYNVC